MLFRGKQAFHPPDVKRLPSPIVICNIRGIGDVLPAPKDFFIFVLKHLMLYLQHKTTTALLSEFCETELFITIISLRCNTTR